MTKYSAAHSAPGKSQPRTSTAMMDMRLVSSTTVMTLTSELSLRRATKSFVSAGSGMLTGTPSWKKYIEENELETDFVPGDAFSKSMQETTAQLREQFKNAGIKVYR